MEKRGSELELDSNLALTAKAPASASWTRTVAATLSRPALNNAKAAYIGPVHSPRRQIQITNCAPKIVHFMQPNNNKKSRALHKRAEGSLWPSGHVNHANPPNCHLYLLLDAFAHLAACPASERTRKRTTTRFCDGSFNFSIQFIPFNFSFLPFRGPSERSRRNMGYDEGK